MSFPRFGDLLGIPKSHHDFIKLNTPLGLGTIGSTRILTWTNVESREGSSLVYGTDNYGDYIKVGVEGLYAIVLTGYRSAVLATIGISNNASEAEMVLDLSNSIIDPLHRLVIMDTQPGASTNCTAMAVLLPGDVLRVHGDSAGLAAAVINTLVVAKIG